MRPTNSFQAIVLRAVATLVLCLTVWGHGGAYAQPSSGSIPSETLVPGSPEAIALKALSAEAGAWCGTRYSPQAGAPLNQGGCLTNGICDDPSFRDGTSIALKYVAVNVNIIYRADGSGGVTTGQAENMIDQLNLDLLPYNIQFFRWGTNAYYDDEVAEIPWNTSDVTLNLMKERYASHIGERINIFISNAQEGPSGEVWAGQGILPWDPKALTGYGGIWINSLFADLGWHSLTHEAGHLLGLLHPFRGVYDFCGQDPEHPDFPCHCDFSCYEFVDRSDADNRGDFCEDTPATPRNYSCSDPSGTDCAGDPWGNTQPENFMSYAPEGCISLFTPQQEKRMHCWMQNSLYDFEIGPRTISGYVRDSGGIGIAGAELEGFGYTVTTSPAGFYTGLVPFHSSPTISVKAPISCGGEVHQYTDVLFDQTNQDFTNCVGPVPFTITVTTPSGGESWEIGSTHVIEWSVSGGPEYATVQDVWVSGNFSNFTKIGADLPAEARSWSWQVSGPSGTTNEIVISAFMDDGSWYLSQSSNIFDIVLPAPIVSMPAGGGTLIANGLFRVQWHYPSEPPEGTILDHTILIDYGDGSPPTTLASGLGNIRWHDATVPTVYSSNASIIVEATWDDGTITQGVTPAITIAPNTAIAQPEAGLHYVPQNPLTVQWVACPNGCSTMESYDISFSNDGGQTFSLEAHITDPMISIYALSFSDPQGNQCRVKIDYHYTDVATGLEQTLTSETGDFSIDNEFLGYLWYEQPGLVPAKASTTILDHNGNGKLDLIINEGDFLSTYEFDEFSPFGVFVGGSDLLETCTDCPSLDPITDFAFADFDNDGDLDVYLGRNGPNYLIENNGDGTYSRYQSSIVEDGGWCSSVSWVDYDSNGELDILVCNLGQNNRMLRNVGGVFNEEFVGLNAGSYEKATWADYDGDGDLDVYMVGFNSESNKLFRYDGAAGFSERNILGAHLGAYVLDAEWADFDNDGDMDLSLVDGPGEVFLYENQGDSGEDVQFASSVIHESYLSQVNSLAWADIDNDGDLDCWVGGHNTYLENEGGGVFVPYANLPGQTNLGNDGYNLIPSDLDGDGAIDVFIDDGDFGIVDANFFQYVNTSGNHWLAIELVGFESNRDAIGAVASIQNGTETITRFVNGDGGRFGRSFGQVHVGLGDMTSCSVKVEWPSGIVQNVNVTQVDRVIAIQENTPGSGCPYVYVYDGKSYVQGNTILHEVPKTLARRAESSARDEYMLATKPASVNGFYQVEIREFEQEHSYIDQVELLAVDHPTGSLVALLDDGRVVTHSGRLAPSRAIASDGTDITELLLTSDGEVFEGQPGDWVDIQYDVPEDGQLVATFQSQQKNAQAPQPKTPTGIEVLVLGDTPQESRSIGMVQPRELLSPQSLALADSYRGGQLVLRLQWHTKHALDDAAILTGVGSVLRRKQAPISSVTHSTRNYSRSVISKNDADYAELLPGETLNLEFEAIPEKGGDRSFLLAVNGHYVHLDQVPGEATPREVRLHPGSPQPFNPRTTLRFDLPRTMYVDMDIYSVSGRLVRKVLSRDMTAGVHEVVWDGTTSGGDQAAAGTYFVRLQTEDGVQTQKLLLVK